MIVNEHELVTTGTEGNGFHGVCKHCGVSLVTDLGYCSWDDLKCINREVDNYNDIPKEIKSFANWKGLKWIRERKIYVKPYSEDEYTIDDLNNIVTILKNTKVNQ